MGRFHTRTRGRRPRRRFSECGSRASRSGLGRAAGKLAPVHDDSARADLNERALGRAVLDGARTRRGDRNAYGSSRDVTVAKRPARARREMRGRPLHIARDRRARIRRLWHGR